MKNKLFIKKILNKIFYPTRIFLTIFIVAIIRFAPITTKLKQTIKISSPILIEYNNNNLLLDIPEASASCAPSCRIRVCVDWDPTPCGTNDWDIGCCLAYADECDPDCDTGGGGGNQPPTISHVLTCSQLGSNDWCIGTLSLDLTASDPQSAQIVISGDVDGIAFACPTGNVTCSIPLSDGGGTINYRVDSSTGLSDSDTTTYKKDSTTPQINGSITGTNGLNDWYISSTAVSATSNDSTSGISIFEMNVDNTGWVNYGDTNFNDGIHYIQYRAIDNAGNLTETAIQEIKVDIVTPVINISITGATGLNNWYTSNVILSAVSNDITSGVSLFEINVNNIGWVSYVETTLTDGIHSVQYRATDNAGNTTITVEQEIKVDTTTPNLTLSTNSTQGMNGWYVLNASVIPTATDLTSGIQSVEFSLNNGIFSPYTSPLQFTDGIHSYQIKATDNAGNITTTPLLTLKIDTVAPIVNKDTKIKLGDELSFSLFDATSGLWIQRVVIEDEDEKYKKIVWLDTISGNQVQNSILWDGKFADKTQAPTGEYYIVFKISDQAGNETFHTTEVTVNVLSFLLPITPFTPPTSELVNEPASQQINEEEQSFGNESNRNESSEMSSSSSGGETVFHGLTAQTGVLSSSSLFNFGNDITTTSTTNSNILWGAIAAAALGATFAEWQRQKQEEERLRAEQPRGTSKGARAKYEAKMRQKRIVGESQALLNEKRNEQEKQNEVSAARWNGLAQIELAKEKAKQIAVSAARWTGLTQIEQNKEKANIGGSKPLFAPVNQNPNPPDDKPWWEKFKEGFNEFLYKIWHPEKPLTPTVAPWWFTPSPTSTPTLQQTPTSIYTPTARPTSSYLEDQLYAYGIQLHNVDSSLINTIFQANQLAVQTFQPRTGGTPQQSFIMSHGTIAIIIDEDAHIDKGNCETEKVVPGTRYWTHGQDAPTFNVQNTITCKEPPTLTNLLHEYVHAFDNNYKDHGSPNQEHLLSDHLGNLVVDGQYVRQILPEYVIRTTIGFNGNSVSSLENAWAPLLSEEFADTQMNAILNGTGINTNGFSDDRYGNARQEEWNSLMNQWEQDMQNWFDWFLR